MLNRIKISIAIVFMIFQISNILHAQDSWTESWQLVWKYEKADIIADTVVAFDIFKGLSNNPTKKVASVDSSKRSWRDHNIQPNTNYYYRAKARNYKDISSDYSNTVTAAIPIATMDTLYIKGDTLINLNKYAADKDYDYSQYKDSLSWLVNDKSSFSSSIDNIRFTISINDDDMADFKVVKDSQEEESDQLVTVYFSVIDPDSFFYKRKTIIKFTNDFVVTPPDTSEPPPDSSKYDPEKETLVYPVPFRASVNDHIVFDNLPPGGTLLIFDVMGGLVFKKEDLENKQYQWNVTNNSGKKINAGLYIFHVQTKNGSKIDSGKVVIIR